MGFPFTLTSRTLLPILQECFSAYAYIGLIIILPNYLKDILRVPDEMISATVHIFLIVTLFMAFPVACRADKNGGRHRTLLLIAIAMTLGFMILFIGCFVGSKRPDLIFIVFLLNITAFLLIFLSSGSSEVLSTIVVTDQIPNTLMEERRSVFPVTHGFYKIPIIISLLVCPIFLDRIDAGGEDGKRHYRTLTLSFAISGFIGLVLLTWGILRGAVRSDLLYGENMAANILPCIVASFNKTKHDRTTSVTGTILDNAFPEFAEKYIKMVLVLLNTTSVTFFAAVPYYCTCYFIVTKFYEMQGQLLIRNDYSVLPPYLIIAIAPLMSAVSVFCFHWNLYPALSYCMNVTALRKMGTASGFTLVAAIWFMSLQSRCEDVPIPSSISDNKTLLLYHADFPVEKTWVETDDEREFHFIAGRNGKVVSGKHVISFLFNDCAFTHEVNFLQKQAMVMVVEGHNTTNVNLFSYERTRVESGRIEFINPYRSDETQIFIRDSQGAMFQANSSVLFPTRLFGSSLVNLWLGVDCDILPEKCLLVSVDTRYQRGGRYLILRYGRSSLRVHQLVSPNSLSAGWFFFPFLFLGLAEPLVVAVGMEFSFDQAPIEMKALVQSTWQLFALFGLLIGYLIALIPPVYNTGIVILVICLFLAEYIRESIYFTYHSYEEEVYAKDKSEDSSVRSIRIVNNMVAQPANNEINFPSTKLEPSDSRKPPEDDDSTRSNSLASQSSSNPNISSGIVPRNSKSPIVPSDHTPERFTINESLMKKAYILDALYSEESESTRSKKDGSRAESKKSLS